MPQFVRLVNTDDSPFDFHHNNIKMIVKGGGDTIVPWNVACTLFGDPTLVDTPRDPARSLSLKQARGTYNYMLGMESDEAFDARRPHIQVWDVEQSPMQRIYMTIEDPDGKIENVGLANHAGLTDIQILQNQVAVLTQHLSRLTAQAAGQVPGQMQRPDGQTVIPSTDTGPSAPYVPSPAIATDEQGHVQAMTQGLMAQLNLTPEQVAVLQANSMNDIMAEALLKANDLPAQFISQGVDPNQYPDDTLDDLNRIPPPPIAANDPMYDQPVDDQLGDLQLVGALSQNPVSQATVDGPPTASTPTPTLPPRPGH